MRIGAFQRPLPNPLAESTALRGGPQAAVEVSIVVRVTRVEENLLVTDNVCEEFAGGQCGPTDIMYSKARVVEPVAGESVEDRGFRPEQRTSGLAKHQLDLQRR